MSGNAIVLWVLGGAGVVLIYSAYKNVPATDVISGKLFQANATTAPVGYGTSVSGGPDKLVSAIPPNNQSQSDTGYWQGNNGTGANGQPYIYDANGFITGTLPKQYNGSPATYIQNA